jgi:DNA segregation ATPase FtsK/SpoIIIE, S-DNA-T family
MASSTYFCPGKWSSRCSGINTHVVQEKMKIKSGKRRVFIMLSALAVAKAVGLVGCSWGAWRTWRSMPEPAARARLREVFRLGQLGIKRKKGKSEDFIFPVIDSVSIKQDCMQLKFTLPPGLEPDKVHKHLWLFRQKFGEDITLEGNNLAFTLRVYPSSIKSFDYDWKVVQRHIDGYSLPIVCGQSRDGWEVYDMVDHPHLLIAGETGSGKSVTVRQILTSIILCGTNVHLYCADLKRSEFHLFKEIAKEVIIEPAKLKGLLMKLKKELKRRGDMLDDAECAHVDDLPEKLPYIVLAIDEVALLKKETACMEIIEEISAIGRALGVFLILSMQRPDADVLDGKLKNNLTVRMAFRHSDGINSRITIGTEGAEDIKQSEKGLMLLKLDRLKCVQSPHLTLPEAKKLLEPFKQKGEIVKLSEDEYIEVLPDEPERQSDII